MVRGVAARVVDRTVVGVDHSGAGSNFTDDAVARLIRWFEREVSGAANVSGTYSFGHAGGTPPATSLRLGAVVGYVARDRFAMRA